MGAAAWRNFQSRSLNLPSRRGPKLTDSHPFCPDPDRLSPNQCSNGTRVMQQPVTSELKISGSVSGDSMRVSSTTVSRVTDSGNGNSLGTFTVHGTISLTRQN
jgi:hypothetical protein